MSKSFHIDLAGRKFGRLTVVEFIPTPDKSSRWIVLCDCGVKKSIQSSALTSGATVSCGCFHIEKHREVMTKHGHSSSTYQSRTYSSWANMMARCHWGNGGKSEHHGGRGIEVFDAWHNFEGFLKDMGECPNAMSIDRFPDNDGNYEPGNCRWATRSQQARNRSSTLRVMHAGVLKDLPTLCEELDISYRAVMGRAARNGKNYEKALTDMGVDLG